MPGPLLKPSGNALSVTESATGPNPEGGLVFLDRLDLQVALPAAGASVARVAPYDPALGVAGAVDYLVVAPSAYHTAAQRLADGRRGVVAKTAVLDVERAYDAFAGGAVEPNAIKRALKKLSTSNGLKYVVLLGADTNDPRNFQGQAPDEFLPSLLSYDDNFGRVPSEYLYADVDDAGAPELAIGRLPARSAAQAEALVGKSLDDNRLLTGGGNRNIFVADDNGLSETQSFEAEATVQAAAFPAGQNKAFVRVAAGADSAREQLAAQLATGALTLSYFGHGSLTYWADEQVLSGAATAALTGTDKGFVAFAWNCLSNGYTFSESSLGESLLDIDDGGAVASLGPVGNSNPDFHHRFAQQTYKEFLNGVPLGEAVRRARASLPRGAFKHVLNGRSLLGDPLVRRPNAQ